ncbi:hypothetical protein LSH36_201g04019 [Paralvinella palmiformis]|uniref:J domain-containing protein n=1 Tax=Paralvinella palmiformis TaxID=53620 RepID=A0AAD9JQZ1_9ANNE|nr:hypothetical protein LSH36_201g04019 [Paralvinella palmiformis]
MDSILSYERLEEDDYYNILGCDELSSIEQICAEYRLKAVECHPDKHPEDPDAAKKFATLQRAKETLCDPKLRVQYDTWKRSGLSMSYQDWKARKDTIHTSLHWAVMKKKEPMIEDVKNETDNEPCSYTTAEESWISGGWRRESSSSILNQFRNYEI